MQPGSPIRFTEIAYVGLTVMLTVYGQLIVKWRVGFHGTAPKALPDLLRYVLGLFTDLGVVSGLFAALLAAAFWMLAISRLPVSYAYPLTTLSLVLVVLLGAFIFHESLPWTKVVGVGLIVIGAFVVGFGKAS